MAISDSHDYRIWPYFVLVSSSSGVSESFVVKNNHKCGSIFQENYNALLKYVTPLFTFWQLK